MGGGFKEDLKSLAAQPSMTLLKALSDAASLGAEGNDKDVPGGQLVKQLNVIVQQFDGGNGKAVTPSASAPAPTLLSTLHEETQGQADNGERERAWKQVQQEIRKFVTLSTPRAFTKDGLASAWRSCGQVFQHAGSLNTSRTEDTSEPWSSETKPPDNLRKDVTDFATSVTGSQPRTPGSAWLAQDREHCCALPCLQGKGEDMQEGKLHFVWRGLYLPGNLQRSQLSRLLRAAPSEKAKVLARSEVPQAPEDWQDRNGTDVPLFWQEGKPIRFYLSVLDEFKIKAAFDVTAGSGALMEACLTRGVLYHGLCQALRHALRKCISSAHALECCSLRGPGLNRDHLHWLSAVADRAACGLMSVEGSSLYSDEAAATAKKHFSGILRQRGSPAD